ncbi:unnamed protein product [Lymnaea stagnalis]|uniref:LIM zinc-binding domain-containing protein n=1 Tax=Lymnaea stagnalis TaxID=6523 RepID=A0AAV2HW72_LYMST
MHCLTCSDCHFRLDSELTCFARDGNIYCKTDYYRGRNGGVRRTGGGGVHLIQQEVVGLEVSYGWRCLMADFLWLEMSYGWRFLMAGDVLWPEMSYGRRCLMAGDDWEAWVGGVGGRRGWEEWVGGVGGRRRFRKAFILQRPH